MAGVFGRLIGLGSAGGALKRAQALAEQGKRAEAFPLLAKAAQGGIAEAEYLVGRAYLEAAGVPRSATEATRWLEKAAEHGYVEAQSLLGAVYLSGITGVAAEAAQSGSALFATAAAGGSVQPDFDKAAHWARRAAEGGSADGQALLGYILTSGPESLRDLPAAEDWYRKAAAANSPQGQLGFGMALLRRAKTAEEQAAGAAELAKAAESGLPTAQYLLGV
ncbi:MAG: tetratricopeptide repeat protein, partial [Rhodospirillales bacterium]|nr:tetratricopeptide repeat protein [Rhodospirillales bacterium]